ncbi:MAG: hypothetical protein LUQ47_00895 [Methanotrichaceae archaeon]|nr:hypothetical protein [Methanotrichaceae archaeon]
MRRKYPENRRILLVLSVYVAAALRQDVDTYRPSELQNINGKKDARKVGLPRSRFVFEAVESIRASKMKNLDLI